MTADWHRPRAQRTPSWLPWQSPTRPRKENIQRPLAIGICALALLSLAYPVFIQPRLRRLGATELDVARAMLGDELVPDPMEVATRATTVDAPPEFIWPWLVQQGYRRGGLYSYDALCGARS